MNKFIFLSFKVYLLTDLKFFFVVMAMEVAVNTFRNSNHFQQSLHTDSETNFVENGSPELDEKRQIRAVQEYLYRLYEVRE